MHWGAGTCSHATYRSTRMLQSAVASFRVGCLQFCLGDAVTAAASLVCDGDSSVCWMMPECHLGLGSLDLTVAFQSALQQGHTQRHTQTEIPVCLPIVLSACLSYLSYLLTSWHTHTITQTTPHTCARSHFQPLAAVIQDQFLPCKYSKSWGLFFVTLQCYSVASS